MEILIYSVIFAVAAIFLIGVLTAVTGTQLRQISTNEVNQQVSFVSGIIQNLVRESSLIENEPGVASSSLVIRTGTEENDPSLIYLENDKIYLKEGNNNPIALTTDDVIVTDFQVVRHGSSGSFALVNVDLTIEYDTDVPRAKIAKTWQSAIGRVRAASFDSSIIPDGVDLDIGSAASAWRRGYFSDNVQIMGQLGLGISPSSDVNMKIKSDGNIGFTSSTLGVVLKSLGGTCYRITVNDDGILGTEAATCP